jgi:hypothetical protein
MTDRLKVKRLLKIWVTLCIIVIILGYGIFQAKNIIAGPKIEVSSPVNGASLGEPLIEIHGTARHISFLTLNGDKIYTDEAGAFREKILLSYGYNIMTLEAKDRFGRKVTKTLELIYK